MDTNGRRNDVVNALQGYLSILDDVQNKRKLTWASLPESLGQFEFYQQAIAQSPEVFQQHGPYDQLMEELKNNQDFFNAVESGDIDWIQENRPLYDKLIKQFDKGIEDRARHYTSNLVKLGFADKARTITPVGELLLDLTKLKRDELEKMLPIDGVNLVYLRQLLKLRLFTMDEEKYYAPFYLALYALLKKPRFSENAFLELVQGLNPNLDVSNIETYILNYEEGDIVDYISISVPEAVNTTSQISESEFRENFKNRKSNTAVNTYLNFYHLLWEFHRNQTDRKSVV